MSEAGGSRTHRGGARARVRWALTALGATALATAVPSGAAVADETHTDSHNGHRITVISIGQIDDPMEDVLEHASILGGDTSTVG
ncbi:hypothetical protein ACSMX9_19575 [Streptomyces sp. LE64]|jgi:hypothetical protein|uniref:hypothetical protein n=1 Tax=unclassified Streptomyces TaxID=2593676 RepID=UPI003330EB48